MPKEGKTLSIFVDESGTFRHPDPFSRYYIVGLVFHDQTIGIQRLADELDVATTRMGLDPEAARGLSPWFPQLAPSARRQQTRTASGLKAKVAGTTIGSCASASPHLSPKILLIM